MKTFLLLVVLLFAVNSAFGCDYIGIPDPPDEYIAAKTAKIFLGEVFSRKVSEQTVGNQTLIVQRVKLRVEKALKGTTEKIIEITFSEKKTKDSCDNAAPTPQPKEKWMIFLGYDEGNNTHRYVIDPQSLSFRYEPETHRERVEKLEKITQNPATGIFGEIEFFPKERLNDFSVRIEGASVKQDFKLDESGKFRLENIPLGNYRVKLFLPLKLKEMFNFEFRKKELVFDASTDKYIFEYEVAVGARSAAYNYFVFYDLSKD